VGEVLFERALQDIQIDWIVVDNQRAEAAGQGRGEGVSVFMAR